MRWIRLSEEDRAAAASTDTLLHLLSHTAPLNASTLSDFGVPRRNDCMQTSLLQEVSLRVSSLLTGERVWLIYFD
jgi:hypothetical protein